MKRLIYIFTLTLVLVACGTRRGYFSLEGRLLNLNQGEFYVYSPDGVFDGVDTIKVEGGRFTFETPCKESGTIMIVFPNFSEQPVFAEPGKNVTIKGDASHLKEIEIEGTDENKLMNGFRQQISKASPPEVLKYAEQFVKHNPRSTVSVYILRKYFINTNLAYESKDLDKAEQLIRSAKNGMIGAKLPSFTAKDIDDGSVSDARLKGRVALVFTWANWNYDSRNMRNRLSRLKEDYGDRFALMGISLDAAKDDCKRTLRNDSTSTITICDQMMFDSPLMDAFGFGGVGENILFNAQGRVIERNMKYEDIESKLKTLLN